MFFPLVALVSLQFITSTLSAPLSVSTSLPNVYARGDDDLELFSNKNAAITGLKEELRAYEAKNRKSTTTASFIDINLDEDDAYGKDILFGDKVEGTSLSLHRYVVNTMNTLTDDDPIVEKTRKLSKEEKGWWKQLSFPVQKELLLELFSETGEWSKDQMKLLKKFGRTRIYDDTLEDKEWETLGDKFITGKLSPRQVAIFHGFVERQFNPLVKFTKEEKKLYKGLDKDYRKLLLKLVLIHKEQSPEHFVDLDQQ